jgi:hypothetical protein
MWAGDNMSLRNAQPLIFSPRGLSDAQDERHGFPGACAVLQNLIPDASTENLWTCRPAATELITVTDFAANGVGTPGVISKFRVFGTYVFGMIANGSGTYAGLDTPFLYNLATKAFIPVYNIQTTNCPATTPLAPGVQAPTIDMVGSKIYVTHPGFSPGVSGWFGWLDLSVPLYPSWSSGNFMAAGGVKTFSITQGNNQTPGIYAGVTWTGGTGTGYLAVVVVNGAGHITNVVTTNPGSGYTVGDSLQAVGLGGGTNDGRVTVSTIGNGQIRFQDTSAPAAWVRQFYQRAYIGFNPGVGSTISLIPSIVYTDTLSNDISNANQALTFGDNNPLVAAAPLGLANQLGGIISSLMVFKDVSNVIQITGDAALSTLSTNVLNTATGTLSPSSIAPSPKGVMFLAPDGFRSVNFDANITDPIGDEGKGITIPFIKNGDYSILTNAACSADVLRISTLNVTQGNVWQEYWYEMSKDVWSGPHTFPSTCIDTYGDSFVITPQAVPGTLWQSDVNPTPLASFVENGVQLTWKMQSVIVGDESDMAESEATEFTVKTTAAYGTPTLSIQIDNEQGNSVGSATYTYTGLSATLWDQAQWDVSTWGSGGVQLLRPRRIDFSEPVIYSVMQISYTGQSTFNFSIGDTMVRRRQLGYLQQYA